MLEFKTATLFPRMKILTFSYSEHIAKNIYFKHETHASWQDTSDKDTFAL